MSNIMEYKGYIGSVEYSDEDRCLFGQLLGIRDAISYEADNVSHLRKSFEDSVDLYLENCYAHGETPQKPYRGTFNVRISPELHQKAALTALEKHTSLNKIVESAIRAYVL